MSFWAFHKLAYFSTKWANIYLSSVLGSTGGGFHQFQRLSRKSKKLKFFMTADLRENCHFWAFHIFTYFSPKWANIYFSSVLWSTGGCFHHFKKLFGELKKLKIFPILALREKCHFGHFTNLHISHQNGQIFTFWEICKFVKCPKWHFSRRAGVGKIFNFFNSPKSLLKGWKQPPVDHRTLEK